MRSEATMRQKRFLRLIVERHIVAKTKIDLFQRAKASFVQIKSKKLTGLENYFQTCFFKRLYHLQLQE